jgi:uncharacterized surface protein with fasciclin (FAS1) repeats
MLVGPRFESLLNPENKEKLKAILLYHVVWGDVTAAQVVKLSSAKTANGQDLKLMVNDATVMVVIVDTGQKSDTISQAWLLWHPGPPTSHRDACH